MVASVCWLAALAALALLAWLTIRYSLLVPAVRGLPILMYHHVDPTRKDALTVTAEQFAAQLRFLATAGYQSITCRDVVDHLEHGTALPARPVLLTFDDGYVNNLEYAYPLLVEHGFKATIFLPVGLLAKRIGGTTEASRCFRRNNCPS